MIPVEPREVENERCQETSLGGEIERSKKVTAIETLDAFKTWECTCLAKVVC